MHVIYCVAAHGGIQVERKLLDLSCRLFRAWNDIYFPFPLLHSSLSLLFSTLTRSAFFLSHFPHFSPPPLLYPAPFSFPLLRISPPLSFLSFLSPSYCSSLLPISHLCSLLLSPPLLFPVSFSSSLSYSSCPHPSSTHTHSEAVAFQLNSPSTPSPHV